MAGGRQGAVQKGVALTLPEKRGSGRDVNQASHVSF